MPEHTEQAFISLLHRRLDAHFNVIKQACTGQRSRFSDKQIEPRPYEGFGRGDDSALVAWAPVDPTFATQPHQAPDSVYQHGSCAPEKQELGEVWLAAGLKLPRQKSITQPTK